jgi:hypothetical protein
VKLFDAINASPVEAAVRYLNVKQDSMRHEPNIVLVDKGEVIKAFYAMHTSAWERRPLRQAKTLEDWRPAKDRGLPATLYAPDVVTQLGEVSDG